MNCLGYALLHPLQLERTLNGSELTLAFDDGVDVTLAALGAGGLGAFGASYEAEFERQLDQIGAQIQSLAGPGGPLASLASIGDLFDADIDIVAAIQAVADFMCDLEPTVVQGLLSGFIDQLAANLPVLQPTELGTRGRTLVLAGLGALEGPLLSGRTDFPAHRSYRAAAAIRRRIDPVLDRMEEALQQADPLEAIRSLLDGLPDVDEEAVTRIRAAGCFVRDNVMPLVRCAATFSGSFTVGGGQGQPPAVPLADDALPAPHPPQHWLWTIDLLTNVGALVSVIYDSARTQNPPERFMQLIFTDILRPLWVAFRTVARAVRWDFINGPEGTSDGDRRQRAFVRFLFSDFGDFAVQFVLEIFGSIHDMVIGWANWISTIGLRLVKYYGFVGQWRTIYLFLRSAVWVREWGNADAATRPKVPMARFAWLVFGPAAFASWITGLVFGGALWQQFHIEGIWMNAGTTSFGGGFALLSLFLTPFVAGRPGDRYQLIGPGDIERAPGEAMFALFGATVVLFIATQTFVQAAPSGGVTALAIIAPLLPAIFGFFGIADKTEPAARWAYYFLVILNAIMMSGVLTIIFWWYALADGSDRRGVFTGLDPATSPYRLPYPAGESWLCGQNSHGFFSHQMFNADLRTRNTGNHFSYDLNEKIGSTVLASRTGLVSQVGDAVPDGNRMFANRVEIQNLDWVAGHDPGWDEERALTYTTYLHLANNRAHVYIDQLVRQGYHIADSDDTGISAMDHLHYSADTGQSTLAGIINLPSLFREGKPNSLAFYRSTNTRVADTAVTPLATTIPLALDSGGSHTHTARFDLAMLQADGTLPADITLTTDLPAAPPPPAAGAPPLPALPARHRHQIAVTQAQLQQLLRNGDPQGTITSTAAAGHTHTVATLPTTPPTPPGGPVPFAANAPGATPQFAAPPPATLLSRDPPTRDDDYQLLGRQMLLRVNDRVTEWHTFGNHRASVRGRFTLDRGPGNGAGVQVTVGAGAPGIAQVTQDLMARAAGTALAPAALGNLAIRTEPVLVVETRMRGSDARLQLTDSPPSLPRLTTALARGSGTVPRLDNVTPTRLRNLINAAFTQTAPPAVTLTTGAGSLDIDVGGASVTSYAGSTGRLEEVLAAIAPTGLVNRDPLPLTCGNLVLTAGTDTFTVPIPAAPARIVIAETARAPARLDAGATGNIASETLQIRVRDDTQTVALSAADAAFDVMAQRIMSNVEGVRAWRSAAGELVIETVAAGDDVTLTLTKGGATFPAVVPGTAPLLPAVSRLGDSTAVTLTELRRVIESARTEATRPNAPANAAISSGDLNITANPSAAVTLTGPAVLMAALGVTTAAGPGLASVTATPTVTLTGLGSNIDLAAPGWIDVDVGGTTWRVDITAEPARAELAAEGLPQAGEALRLTVNGTPVVVQFQAGDVTSLHAVAERIRTVVNGTAGVDGGITIRTAYRYAFESAIHGGDDIDVGAANSPGLASAGFAGRERDAGRGTVVDAAGVGRPAGPGGVPPASQFAAASRRAGRTVRAFTAAGSPLVFAATGGGDVTITALDNIATTPIDPLGIVGSPAPSLAGGPFDLGRSSVGYAVAAGGATADVELNAAPAHLRSLQSLAFAAASFTGGAAPLTVTVTDPAGVATTAAVDLAGVASLAQAAALLQREAPHVRSWVGRGNLIVESRGRGHGWRLALSGEQPLLGLGFDPDRIDAAGAITVTGAGNVENAAAVTLAEIEDAFHTMGGLATLPTASELTVTIPTPGTTRVTSAQGQVAITSTPGPLAAALGVGAPANQIDLATPVALDNGWLHVTAGGRHVATGAVWGRRAAVEAANPLPANLSGVGGTVIQLNVDGGPAQSTTLPAPGFSSSDELLRHLNVNLGSGAWFGLVRRGADQHLRVESRTRGSASAITILSTPGALGLGATPVSSTQPGQVSGAGSVPNLAAITDAQLEAVLNDGIGRGNVPQEAVQAAVAASQLTLTAAAANATVNAAASPPHGLGAAPAAANSIAFPFATPIDTGPHLTDVLVVDAAAATAQNRRVVALLLAEPARLGTMTVPANKAVLNGQTLQLTAGGVASTVTFAGVATDAAVVDQIQRATAGAVRASITGTSLLLETVVAGSSASLSMDVGASTATAQLGTPAPASSAGSGNVADIRAVTAAEYAGVIAAGFTGPDTTVDRANAAVVPVGARQSLVAGGGPTAPQHAQFQSRRTGCDSALELLPRAPGASAFAQQLAAGPFRFERSLARGPAVRASVALPAFVDGGGAPTTRALAGDLWIRLNDNPAGSGLAVAADVQVQFDGSYTAEEAAAVIDEALGGAGTAAAFPDQTIVVETASPGLAGTVTMPAPAPASTAGVLSVLGIGAPLTNRGWPAGVGFRGHTGNSLAGLRWQFTSAAGASTPITITAGQTPAAAATAVDAALRAPVGGGARMGLAAVGDDGALYVELYGGLGAAPALAIDTTAGGTGPLTAPASPPTDPFRIWLGGDVGVEPAFELRRTDVLRTVRIVYFDRRGDDELFIDPALFSPDPAPAAGSLDQRVFDVGWVRPPTNATGIVGAVQRWMRGRWLLACRVEGARSDDGPAGSRTPAYGPGAEMIRSGGTAPIGGETVHFATQVRYWVNLTSPAPATSSPLRVAQVGTDFLVDFVVL